MFNNLFNPSNKSKIKENTKKTIGIQNKSEDNLIHSFNLLNSDNDQILNWNEDKFKRPLCSRSSFPNNPSKNLVEIVNFFDNI